MDVGNRNQRVQILSRVKARDDANDLVYSWQPFGNRMWANIRHSSGLQLVKAGAERAVIKASVRVAYRRDLASGMRLQHGRDVYEVEAALRDEEEREHTDLVCRLLTPAEVEA